MTKMPKVINQICYALSMRDSEKIECAYRLHAAERKIDANCKCKLDTCTVEIIAFFKIKAHIHMNGTTLNSQKARHSERRVGSRSEEHPMTLP